MSADESVGMSMDERVGMSVDEWVGMSVDERVGMSLDECAEHGYLARLLCLSIIFYAFNYTN